MIPQSAASLPPELRERLYSWAAKLRSSAGSIPTPPGWREELWAEFYEFSLSAWQATRDLPADFACSGEFAALVDLARDFIAELIPEASPYPQRESPEKIKELFSGLMLQRWLVILARESGGEPERSPLRVPLFFRRALTRKLQAGVERRELLARMPERERKEFIGRVKDLEYELGVLPYPSPEYIRWEQRYAEEYLDACRKSHIDAEEKPEAGENREFSREVRLLSPFLLRQELLANQAPPVRERGRISIGWTVFSCRLELLGPVSCGKPNSVFFPLARDAEY